MQRGNGWTVYSPGGVCVSTDYHCIECEENFPDYETKDQHFLNLCTDFMRAQTIQGSFLAMAGRFPTEDEYETHAKLMDELEAIHTGRD